MSKGILIAGNQSALTSAIEAAASRKAERYALAVIPDRFSVQRQDGNADAACIPLEWNPGSPISARALVLAAENRLGCPVSEAILVCDPPAVRCTAADIDLAHVEMLANDHIKSWFFLVKEVAAAFKAQEQGTLALVYPETSGTGGKDDAVDLLGSTALAAFRSLARSLLAASYSDPYITMGFSGAETGDESGFAAFVFKQLEEKNRKNNGKLHKYGKLGFFR